MTDNFKLPSDVVEEMHEPDLYLSDETWLLAREIAEAVEFAEGLPATTPKVVAAICLYIASNVNDESRSQRLIAESVGLHHSTFVNNKPHVAKLVDESGVVNENLSPMYAHQIERERNGFLSGLLSKIIP